MGASYVPTSLSSETNESVHGSLTAAQGGTGEADRTQKVQADIEDLTSFYVSYHYNMFFIKAGMLEAKLITNENLDSGSTYPDGSLDGKFFGIGFDKDLDDGVFIRGELAQTDFDDIKLTSTGSDNTNVIDITGLTGTNLSISIGKTF